MDPIMGGAILDLGLSLWNGFQQSKTEKKQVALQEKQIQLTEQQYLAQEQARQAWSEKYGGIERNMIDYVKSLDASKVYAQADSTVSRQFENARKNMEGHLASRGFDVAGGVTADLYQNLAAVEAQTKIQYEEAAKASVLSAQQSVLSGNPQPNPTSTANMANAYGNMSNMLGQQQQASAKSLDNIGTSIGDVYSEFDKQDKQDKQDRLDRAKAKLRSNTENAQANVTTTTTTAREVQG